MRRPLLAFIVFTSCAEFWHRVTHLLPNLAPPYAFTSSAKFWHQFHTYRATIRAQCLHGAPHQTETPGMQPSKFDDEAGIQQCVVQSLLWTISHQARNSHAVEEDLHSLSIPGHDVACSARQKLSAVDVKAAMDTTIFIANFVTILFIAMRPLSTGF